MLMPLGPFRTSGGGPDAFAKLKLVSEAYVKLARERGDTYAEAFLKDMRDLCERAITRGCNDRRESFVVRPGEAVSRSYI